MDGECMGKCMDEWMLNEWMDEHWMDGWMDENGRIQVNQSFEAEVV